jgi:hypothetical protein
MIMEELREITKFQEKCEFSPYFPKRHEGQIKVWERWQQLKASNEHNVMVFTAGVRTGKTALGAYIACQEFIDNIIAIRKGKKIKPIHIWIVAPTLDLTQRSFEYVTMFLGKGFPELSKYITKRPSPGVRLPNGAKIECKTAENPDSLLGESLDLVIGDEASRFRPEVWDLYLRARLLDRKGKAIFISTPNGKGWFYNEGELCKDYETYFHFTSYDNPYNDPNDLDLIKTRVAENVWKQEYMAEAQDDAGSVFKTDDIKAISIVERELESIPGHIYTIGVDVAKHVDFTVLTVIDNITNEVVKIDRFNEIEYPLQKQRIIALAKRYNNAKVIFDSTGVGQPIKDDLRRDGIYIDDFIFSNKSKKDLVEKLMLFIENKYIKIPKFKPLLDELSVFKFIRSEETGNIKYAAPLGLHDDCVFSLALAVWGLNGQVNPKTPIQQEIAKIKKQKTRRTYL